MTEKESRITFTTHPYRTYLMTVGSAFAYYCLTLSERARSYLPEPLNLPQHVSNIGGSIPPAALATFLGGYVSSRLVESMEPQKARRYMRVAITAAGTLGALGINLMTETRWGIGMVNGLTNTPDTIDLAYGVLTGAAAGHIVSTVEVYSAHPSERIAEPLLDIGDNLKPGPFSDKIT